MLALPQPLCSIQHDATPSKPLTEDLSACGLHYTAPGVTSPVRQVACKCGQMRCVSTDSYIGSGLRAQCASSGSAYICSASKAYPSEALSPEACSPEAYSFGASLAHSFKAYAFMQVGQVILTLPYSMAQTGMLLGIILQLTYAAMASWTAYLINCLFLEQANRTERAKALAAGPVDVHDRYP